MEEQRWETQEGRRGLTSQNQRWRESRSVWTQSLFYSPFKSCNYPDVAGTAPSSHGLSEGSLLSWTGPPAPAELATKPKNKVMRLFQKAHRHGRLVTPQFPLSTCKSPLRSIKALPPITFLMEPLLLVQDYQFTVLVSLLQHMFTLFDMAVIVLQAQQGGHQGHVRLQKQQDFSENCFRRSPTLTPPSFASGWKARGATQARKSKPPLFRTIGTALRTFMLFHTTYFDSFWWARGGMRYFLWGNNVHLVALTPILPEKTSLLQDSGSVSWLNFSIPRNSRVSGND